jgi:hypothetical protein
MNTLARKIFHSVRAVLPPEPSLSLSYLRSHGRWPDLRHPKTFNEKIQYRKLHDRNPLLPILSDKVLVKNYVREKLGDAWVTPTLWCGKKLPPRSQRDWPVPFAIKANHGCKRNIFVREPEPDWGTIELACDQWIKNRQNPLLLEWAYSEIDPLILVEPFHGSPPELNYEYKFYVFSGRVEYIHVIIKRFKVETIRFYDRKWIAQDIAYGLPLEQEEVPPPPHFSELRDGAEALGAGFPFVRVDLYDQDRPLFGEMTFYPCSGSIGFSPRSWDLKFGELWIDIRNPGGPS